MLPERKARTPTNLVVGTETANLRVLEGKLAMVNQMSVMEDEQGPIGRHRADRNIAAAAADAPKPVAAERLLSTIASLSDSPLYKDCRVQLLVDGPQTYAAMLDAIESARNTIHLETYIFGDEEIGQQFADALIAQSGAGVAVRVIYDSLGSRESDDEFFEEMVAAGIEVLAYNCVNPVSGGNPLTANNRTHRKILVVDSRIAFTGGINISNTYSLSSASPHRRDPVSSGWRDTHVSIEGPAVAAFEKLFAQHWEQGEAKLPVADMLDQPGCEPSDDIIAVLHADGGDDDESAIFHSYFAAVRLAEKRIWITQGYFAPDNRFTDLIVAAAGRGVDVRILVPGFSDSSAVIHASRSRYGRLLKKGVRIYEATNSVLHAKTAVIDGIWSTVGSSNLDSRSFLHNDEVNAVVVGTEFGAQLESQFFDDIEHAKSIRYDEWRKRPVKDRILEFLSWTIEYWL